MNKQRRLFLNQVSIAAGMAALSKPLNSIASVSKCVCTQHAAEHSVTIYHSNDLHGNLNAAFENLGGLNHIKMLIERQETSGLLLDAGDFLNGSHSFIQQQSVIHMMNKMNYHAVAIGNQELANGQDHLATLAPTMKFSMVNCNYQFDERLCRFVSPYVIIKQGKFKVGITGVGHKIRGIAYTDAIESANKAAVQLKKDEKCDLVICLSHLGYKQEGNMPDNQKLAAQSTHIDLIVGGHNRKLTMGPMILRNKLKNEVVVSHAAWDGLMLGKTVFGFENGKPGHGFKAKHFIPGLRSEQSFVQSFAKLKAEEQVA
jgi:5'-nucleotidase